jgi:GNAT superfamily N-acetyltransferase
VKIRPYRPADEPRVLELLTLALGGGPIGERTPEFFAWKHLRNPFGPSLLLVAEAEERIVGLRAFVRWQLRTGDRTVRAVRAVDTATHPDHRRRGVFTRLVSEALDAVRDQADLVFNTPNRTSLPGYSKLGWRTAGRVPVLLRIGRPWRRARRPAVAAETAAVALGDGDAVSRLLAEAEVPDGRLVTPRDLDYLRWRYASAPRLDYRAIRAEHAGRLEGLAVFRVRRRGRLWETALADLIARPGDRPTLRRLLRGVAAAAPVDHLACSFPLGAGPAREARRRGFVRVPAGPTLVVRPLHDVHPDPTDLASWALTLGDLEVL